VSRKGYKLKIIYQNKSKVQRAPESLICSNLRKVLAATQVQCNLVATNLFSLEEKTRRKQREKNLKAVNKCFFSCESQSLSAARFFCTDRAVNTIMDVLRRAGKILARKSEYTVRIFGYLRSRSSILSIFHHHYVRDSSFN
jgi:hypothetical protein